MADAFIGLTTAAAMASVRSLFSMGSSMDDIFDGFYPGEVVEISGEAGVGKSWLCCTLAVHAALPRDLGGAEGRVAFVPIETGFNYSAMADITAAILHAPTSPTPSPSSILDRIEVKKGAVSFEALGELLERLITEKEEGYKLYIIDGIANIARADLATETRMDTIERSQFLFSIAAQLKRLAHVRGAVVVLTNQAADVLAGSDDASGSLCRPRDCAAVSGGRWVRPAMGSAWDTCMTSRIVMVRLGQGEAGGHGGQGRRAYRMMSPRSAPRCVSYVIGPTGVVGVGASEAVSAVTGHRMDSGRGTG